MLKDSRQTTRLLFYHKKSQCNERTAFEERLCHSIERKQSTQLLARRVSY